MITANISIVGFLCYPVLNIVNLEVYLWMMKEDSKLNWVCHLKLLNSWCIPVSLWYVLYLRHYIWWSLFQECDIHVYLSFRIWVQWLPKVKSYQVMCTYVDGLSTADEFLPLETVMSSLSSFIVTWPGNIIVLFV